MAESPVHHSPWTLQIGAAIGTGKDLFALVRDVTLALLAGLLIVFPATFNDRLVKAGFEEGSFAGLKWKAKLVDSDTSLKEARIQIEHLGAQLKITSDKLTEAQSKLNDPKFARDVATVTANAAAAREVAAKFDQGVAAVISSNAALVDHARLSLDGQWGVIYGADTKLERAVYEVNEVAKQHGIPNAAIFLKDGSYRSVSVLGSGEEASEVLQKATQRRADAYIVRMNTWCPTAIRKDGYQQCTMP